jgi:hypothetical protein
VDLLDGFYVEQWLHQSLAIKSSHSKSTLSPMAGWQEKQLMQQHLALGLDHPSAGSKQATCCLAESPGAELPDKQSHQALTQAA